MKIQFKKIALYLSIVFAWSNYSFSQCNWQTLPNGENVNSIARVREDRKVLRSEVFTTAEGAVYAAYYFDDATLSLVPFSSGAWQLSNAITLDTPDGTIGSLKGWALGKIGTDNVFIAFTETGGWYTKNLTTNTNWQGGYIPAIGTVINTVKDVAFHPTSGEIYLLRQPNTTTLAWSKLNTIAYTFTDLGTVKDVTTNTVTYDGGGASGTTTTANTVSTRYMPQLKFYGTGDAIVSYGLQNSLTTFGSGFYPRAVRFNGGTSTWAQVTTQFNGNTRESFINELTAFPFYVESRANDFAISDGPGKPFFTMRPESNPPAYSLYEIDAASNNANNISSGSLNTLSALHTYSASNNDFYGAYSDYITTTFFKRDNGTGVVSTIHSMPTVFANAGEAKGINLFLSGTSLYALEGSRHRNGFFGDYNHQTPSQIVYKTRSLTAPFSVLESNFWMNDLGITSTYSKVLEGENGDLILAYADTMYTDSTYRVAFKKWDGTAWVASDILSFGSSTNQVEDFDIIYNGTSYDFALVKPTGDCELFRSNSVFPTWTYLGTASITATHGTTRFVRLSKDLSGSIIITTASILGTVNKIKYALYTTSGTMAMLPVIDLNFQRVANKNLMQTVSVGGLQVMFYKTQSFMNVKYFQGPGFADWSTTFNTDFNTAAWTSFDAQFDQASNEVLVAYNTSSLNTTFKRAKINVSLAYDATATAALTQLGTIGNAIFKTGAFGKSVAFTKKGSKIYALNTSSRLGNHRMALLKGDITTGVWESADSTLSYGQSTNQDMINSSVYGVVAKWGGNNLHLLNLPGAPAAPVDATASLSVCSGQTKTLTVTTIPGATVNWFAAATGGTSIGTGTSFTTPALTSATSYYAEATNGCGTSTTRTEITVSVLALPTVTIDPSNDQSICQGNGIVLTGQGASTYSWNNSYTNGALQMPALGGTYIVTGTASNGCTNTDTVVVTLLTGPAITSSFSTNDTVCSGEVFSINVSVGAGGYSFDEITSSNGGPIYDFTSATNITSTLSGDYYLSLYGSNGCYSYDTLSLFVQNTATPTHAASETFCIADQSTFADITVTGTNVEWYTTATGGTAIPSTDVLTPGTYYSSQTINGCSSNTRGEIAISVNEISYSITGTDVSCNGDFDGTIDLTATGASALTFAWNDPNNSTTEDLSFLSAGTYIVEVTDAAGCSDTIHYTVNEPASALAQTNSVVHVSCGGSADGEIDLTISGGTAPYDVLWNNGSTSEDLSNLDGGNYDVTITDDNGCEITESFFVNEYAVITISGTETAADCGQTNGAIDASVTGGNNDDPYTYSWSNGATTEDLTALAAGAYILTVTDIDNCSEQFAFTVNSIGGPTATGTATDASCATATDGAIDITVTGTGTITYSWTNGASTEDLSNLAPGTYTVTITDAANCPSFESFIIDGDAYVATLNLSGTTLTATIVGATYQWIDCSTGTAIVGETNQTFTATANGSYAVIVTEGECSDTSDCMLVNTIGLTDNTELEVSIYPNPSSGLYFLKSTETVSFTVYDALGKIILNDTFNAGVNTIDLKSETNGVYILNLIMNNTSKVVRLIKNN